MLKRLLIIWVSILMWNVVLLADNNLREGYVITLQGDTLQGYIEYRTDKMNSERCVFIQDGTSEYKTYLPGEIQGYRFLDNGRYYVSRLVQEKNALNEEAEKMYFVEYVMRGNMSMYQILHKKLYILENEEGQSASFTELDRDKVHSNEERRTQLLETTRLLSPSPKASSLLWRMENNQRNTQKVVEAYNEEVCPNGSCEYFQYKSSKMPKADRAVHPFVMIGVDMGSVEYIEPDDGVKTKGNTVKYVSPSITAGVDVHLNRFAKGLMLQLSVDYCRLKTEKYTKDVKWYWLSQMKANELSFKLGPAYQFNVGKLKPSVGVGYNIQFLSGINMDFVESFKYDASNKPAPWANGYDDEKGSCTEGFYVGIGLEYPLSKGALVMRAGWLTNTYKPVNAIEHFDFSTYYCRLGYKF